ncbi:hypothetical protein M426DRAFT_318875 [Hypoxylon sp. CI-4A]|nr:hypothetical protein M426DRAFT_318875 [Hypoxylon sp. CI-4A]
MDQCVLSSERSSRRPFEVSETLTWMVERVIITDCDALSKAISKASVVLNGFVREIREARSDIDGVSRELHSLQSVLELIKEDASFFPPELAERVPCVVDHCCTVVVDLDTSMSTLSSSDLSKEEKKTRWIATGKEEAAAFRSSLEAHKAIMGIALDLAAATTIRDVTSDTEPNKRNTIQKREISAEVLEDVSRILIEMNQLRMRLPGEFERKENHVSLHDYMNRLKSYAEKIISSKESEHEVEREVEREVEQSIRGGVDSEQSVESEKSIKSATQSVNQDSFLGCGGRCGAVLDKPDSAIDMSVEPADKLNDYSANPEEEKIPTIEELMASFDGVPSRAPTPPPKDIKRLEIARNTMITPFEVPKSPTESFGVVTEISSKGRETGSTTSVKSRGLGRLFAPIRHARNAISEGRPSTRSTHSTAPSDIQPATPIIQASLVRRGSHRLSVSFKKLPMWNPELIVDEPEGPHSTAVFGVSLQKSMQTAKGTSKTHHSGNGGASKRDFPLCMQKCCFFLKNEGVEAPDIFAEPGDSYRIQKLKDIFSSGPTYGDDVNWTNFGVYDAADLILLFLSQLPKPLISEPIAKRWIALSRQATLSGSHATRLDQCIDFWEEALGSLRGPSRTLFKLLLNLWADVAQAAEKNDMTAERLASVLIKPLMHISSEKHETDFMLSLAFLIRRRSEYTELLKKEQGDVRRISRAAW